MESDIAWSALLIGVVTACVTLAFRAAGAERERQARWHHAYYRQGGLIRALMRNWRPSNRLTDQRDRNETDDG